MTTMQTAMRLNDLRERAAEIDVRIESARIAAQFFPELSDGVSIEDISNLVYNWVTKVDE